MRARARIPQHEMQNVISRPRVRCTYMRARMFIARRHFVGLYTYIMRNIAYCAVISVRSSFCEQSESLQRIRCLDRAIASSFRRYFPRWGDFHAGPLPEFIVCAPPQTAFLRIQRREPEFVDRRPISRTLPGFKPGRRSTSVCLSTPPPLYLHKLSRRRDSQYNLNCNDANNERDCEIITKNYSAALAFF